MTDSSDPPRQGRRNRRRERVRASLLDAAATLFARRGLYGTRIEDITEQADLGKGAFYNYFGSKEALAAEVLDSAVEELDRSYLSAVEAGEGAKRVAALVRAHERFFDDHPQYLLLFHQARGMLGVEPTARGSIGVAVEAYLRCLAIRIADSPMPGPREMEIAAVIAGAVAGYRSYRWAAALAAERLPLDQALAAGVAELWSKDG